jgi:RNase P subunit RPR2
MFRSIEHHAGDRLTVTCEECGYKCHLEARLGDEGHEPGDTIYLVCHGCEGVLGMRIPGRKVVRQRV